MELYKELISEIGIRLKKEGFIKKANSFYYKEHENYGIINFQKSAESSADEKKFTINIGISLTSLRKFFEYDTNIKPPITESHWQERIGFFMPEKNDHWWKINMNTDIKKIIDEIWQLIHVQVIPKIKNLISDEAMVNNWLNGNKNGLTGALYYVNLTALLKIHQKNSLETIVKEFINWSGANSCKHIATAHLKQLGLNYE